MSFNGKHALITGSSRGIGRGIALKLAKMGARVAIHYYQNETAANDTLARVRASGSNGFIVQADVSHPDDIRHLFRTVQAEFGTLDIFVSNARPELPTFFYPTMEITLEQWDMAVDSQAKALFQARLEVGGRSNKNGRASGWFNMQYLMPQEKIQKGLNTRLHKLLPSFLGARHPQMPK